MVGRFVARTSVFPGVWRILTPKVLQLAAKNPAPDWKLVHELWADIRFLQILAGLIDIAVHVVKAEKQLQRHDISFVERDIIMTELGNSLQGRVWDQPQFCALMQALENKSGATVFCGIKLQIGGDMIASLKRIRQCVLGEMGKRFANRAILGRLGWLHIASWWTGQAALMAHGVADLRAVFDH